MVRVLTEVDLRPREGQSATSPNVLQPASPLREDRASSGGCESTSTRSGSFPVTDVDLESSYLPSDDRVETEETSLHLSTGDTTYASGESRGEQGALLLPDDGQEELGESRTSETLPTVIDRSFDPESSLNSSMSSRSFGTTQGEPKNPGADSPDGASGMLPDLNCLLPSPPKSITRPGFRSSDSSIQLVRVKTGEPVLEVSDLQLDILNELNLKNLCRNLAEENERLKLTVKRSNVFLRKQRDLIDTWMEKIFAFREQGEKTKEAKNGTEANLALHNLSSQLDVAEEAQAQLSQDLQRVTSEKLELANRVASLQMEAEQRRAEMGEGREELERVQQEKWELTRVNTDLQQRLQQTVALAHMQAEGNESRLQEEVGTLLVQLEEEREVTARLSKNLELERRKLESLEQKSKGSSGKKDGSRRRSSLLPEEIRDSESRLAASMELYRQRCDNLGSSLAGCQQQLDRESWHPDLAIEINKLRKLLSEERRSCYSEGEKLKEVHQLFEQVYQDYSSVVDAVKQAQMEKKQKGQSVLENIKESNIRDNMDSMTARLMDAEESLNREREKSTKLQERLAQAEIELESFPLLKAQVEVYQTDFNAEREARERIAGEKADLQEEVNKLRKSLGMKGGQESGRHDPPNHRAEPPPREPPRQPPRPVDNFLAGNVRERMNQFAEREDDQQLPLPVRQHNLRNVNDEEERNRDLNCPKCGREFRNTTLLTRHVNDCLDRDF